MNDHSVDGATAAIYPFALSSSVLITLGCPSALFTLPQRVHAASQ
jgi:hypothetical protein